MTEHLRVDATHATVFVIPYGVIISTTTALSDSYNYSTERLSHRYMSRDPVNSLHGLDHLE